MLADVIAFPSPALTLAPGVWLYSHVPASTPDALLVLKVEGTEGPRVYDVVGGMRALPRTRVLVRCDGGEGRERWIEHVSTDSLLAYREYNGLTGYYGFLNSVKSDPAAFIARCAAEPARRVAVALAAAEESERVRREVGPWYADVETVLAGERMRDTVQARVIRRALREIVGVRASVTVRRYSMASGLNFGPVGRDAWTDADAERIATLFPGVACQSTRYNRDTGESVPCWRVDDSLHPSAREDRSDMMSDYHAPGGFRVAVAHLLAVGAIVAEETARV